MSGRSKIQALTSLRFFAAFYVLLYHTAPRTDAATLIGEFANRLLSLGYTAVGLFFILSGYILATVYERFGEGVATTHRFWVARFARIYPMYLVSLLMDVPRLLAHRIAQYGLIAGAAGTGATLGWQMAALQSWWPRFSGLNSPSWSISTEVFFYLVFPFVLPIARKIESVRTNLTVMGALWGVMLSWPMIAQGVLGPGYSYFSEVLGHNPIIRLPEFLIGILMANIARRGSEVVARKALKPNCMALTAFALVWFVAAVQFSDSIPDSEVKENLLAPAFAAIILALTAPGWLFVRALSLPMLVLLGEASYALYLLHAPVWSMYLTIASADWGLQGYAAYLGVVVLASIGFHMHFELPLRRAILRHWDRRVERRRASRLASRVGVARGQDS